MYNLIPMEINIPFVGFVLVIIILISFIVLVQYETFPSTMMYEYIDNDHFPESKKVHLFMISDRNYHDLIGKYTKEINKKYAEKHNFPFEYKIVSTDKDNRIHYEINHTKRKAAPHYARYIYAYHYVKRTLDNSYLIYVDTDAAFVDHTLDIRKWIPRDVDTYILFGNEFSNFRVLESIYRNIKFGICFNSGFFILKSNQWTLGFLERILLSDTCTDCRLMKQYGWYDQTCISLLYQKNDFLEKKHVKVIPNTHMVQHKKTNWFHEKFKSGIPILHTSGKKKMFFQTIQPSLHKIIS